MDGAQLQCTLWRFMCSTTACIRNLKSSRCRLSPRDGDSNRLLGTGNSLISASENDKKFASKYVCQPRISCVLNSKLLQNKE